MNEKEIEILPLSEEEVHEEAPLDEMIEDDISNEKWQHLKEHPMFSHFSKGKSGTEEEICRDFEEMLAFSSKEQEKAKNAAILAAKMTPPANSAIPDVALTARQKEIARAAGMSYKEYYELFGEVRGLRSTK